MDTDFYELQTISPPCFMRKLPSELINEIFLQALPSVPSFKALDSPLVLTHVCSWWRAYALELSNLWDTLYLPSPAEGISNGVVRLCALWLERSKARPLSVDFHLTSDYQPWKITAHHIHAVQRVVRILAPHASRIVKLLRVLPRFLLDDLRLEDMVRLDDLFICDAAEGDGASAGVHTHVAPGMFKVPGTLRCLSLRQTFFDASAFASLDGVAHLDLWQLQGAGQMSLATALGLLRALPGLESCTLDIALPAAVRGRVDARAGAGSGGIQDSEQEIVMSNLTFLFLSWDWLVDVGPLLDVIRAPHLRRLGLRGPPPPLPAPSPTRSPTTTTTHSNRSSQSYSHSRTWPHLRRFLRRNRPPLAQLSVKEAGSGTGASDIRLLDCLRLVPRLTNLSLSHCAVDGAFLKALRLGTGVSDREEGADADADVLPALEFLSLEACDDVDVRDLVAMLATRTRTSDDTTLAPAPAHYLRGVRLSYCRRIRESHRAEIEACGVENVVIRAARSSLRPVVAAGAGAGVRVRFR